VLQANAWPLLAAHLVRAVDPLGTEVAEVAAERAAPVPTVVQRCPASRLAQWKQCFPTWQQHAKANQRSAVRKVIYGQQRNRKHNMPCHDITGRVDPAGLM